MAIGIPITSPIGPGGPLQGAVRGGVRAGASVGRRVAGRAHFVPITDDGRGDQDEGALVVGEAFADADRRSPDRGHG
jgi:hypothetical protein